jgi:hypothetical protein
MNHKQRNLSVAAAVAALFAAMPLAAQTPFYTTGVLTNVTSYTISASTSGATSKYIAPVATWGTGGGSIASESEVSWTIDGSYDVTLTFTSAFTGTVSLYTSPSSLTTASTDFQATTDGYWNVYVCAACTASAPAVRNVNGQNIVMEGESTLAFTSLPSSGNIYVYLGNAPQGIVYQITANQGGVATCTGGNCQIVWTSSPATAPAGYIELANGPVINGMGIALADDRFTVVP